MRSILAITSELPWPLTSGGRLRTFHLLRELASRFRVRLVAGLPHPDPKAVDALSASGLDVVPVQLAERSAAGELRRLLSATIRGEPYVLYRRHDRAEMRAALAAEIRRDAPDLLYLDHLDSLVFRGIAPSVPCVIDLHNVYSALTRRTALEAAGPRRWFLLAQARLLARMERRAAGEAAAVFAVSESEREHFAAQTARPVRLVPNGVDCARFEHLPAGERTGGPLVLFVGTLSWPPNVSAAVHLATEVLPDVQRSRPDARLRIVGKAPPPHVRELARRPGVEVTGEVDDVLPHLGEAHCLAVSLDAGGGTRLKILEAFAAGLPVVSTAIGCEGLAVRDGEHLLVRERPAFADGVLELLRDPERTNGLAGRARQLARERYDWHTIGRGLAEAVADVLGPD